MSRPFPAVGKELLFPCWYGNDDWASATTLVRLQLPRRVARHQCPNIDKYTSHTYARSRSAAHHGR
jgi:hypothetical protein